MLQFSPSYARPVNGSSHVLEPVAAHKRRVLQHALDIVGVDRRALMLVVCWEKPINKERPAAGRLGWSPHIPGSRMPR